MTRILHKNQLDNIGKENKKTVKIQKDECGGQGRLEPTRYGDWEKNGKVSDF